MRRLQPPTRPAGSMAGRLGLVAAGLAGLAATAAAVFVVGMRTKSPRVQRAVRRINRAFWNPRAMETAGTPGAWASVVHHVGRRSAAAYHTPVVPVKTDDGFVVALPYGRRADWVQNVLAAGRATLTHEGRTYEVDRPEFVPIESADDLFDDSDQTMHRVFNVAECLRLHIVDAEPDNSNPIVTDRVHTPAL